MFVALLAVLAIATAMLVHALTHPPRRTFTTQLARGLPTDPGEMDLPFETHRVTQFDGSETELWLVEGSAAEGPILIMLHGWGGSRLSGLAWLAMLRPHASRIVLFDQRGHGESTSATCEWGRAERRDAKAIVQHLQKSIPNHPVVLFGLSMGAAVALEAARRSSLDEVAAVIVDSPYRQAVDAVRLFMQQRRLPTFPLLWLGAAALRIWRPGFGGFDAVKTAARLRQPLLVIHGSDDPIVPLQHASDLADAAPNARLEVFTDAGHLQAVTTEPRRYGSALATFLKTIAGDGDTKKARPTKT